jgi:hypothetical protein
MIRAKWVPLNKPGHSIEECLGGCLEHITPEQKKRALEWAALSDDVRCQACGDLWTTHGEHCTGSL